MTWIVEFRPGNKTIYVVFDEESEFSGPRTPKLRPCQVFKENIPYTSLCFNLFVLLISLKTSVQEVKHDFELFRILWILGGWGRSK